MNKFFLFFLSSSIGVPVYSAEIPDQYIVVFKEGVVSDSGTLSRSTVKESVQESAERLISSVQTSVAAKSASDPGTLGQSASGQSISLGYVYDSALQGFSASLTPEAVALLKRDPLVDYIEPDQIITGQSAIQQYSAPWGLDRIDQKSLPLNDIYEYDFTGNGVHVYVVDSGIHMTHNEFSGRVGNGYDAIDGGTPDDCHGHGTHVAGILAGSQYGVAKKATIHPVRTLNCSNSGTLSGVISGIEWVTENVQFPAVMNLSIGAQSRINSLDNAVNGAINAGITVTVAAGNNSRDACDVSPSAVSKSITVAASGENDQRYSDSNIGSCVDIFAPGVAVTSAWNGSDSDTNIYEGTSMASPHVAGIAALHLEADNSLTPEQVKESIILDATVGAISNPGANTVNLLAYIERYYGLAWLDAANAQADAEAAIAVEDYRLFHGIGRGTSIVGVPVADMDEAIQQCGERYLPGATDIVLSDRHSQLLKEAVDYAIEYNRILIGSCLQGEDKTLPTIVVDNAGGTSTGIWRRSGGNNPHGEDSVYGLNGQATFSWPITIPEAGEYDISTWWTYFGNRTTNASYTFTASSGEQNISVNQRDAALAGQWHSLGRYDLPAGTLTITVSDNHKSGSLSADAIKVQRVK
ncbi:S8 family serine peptidase [bacterium]|nr:S8 family serine peptidase [bacterium]